MQMNSSLANPGQMSPEVQNTGAIYWTKRTNVLQKKLRKQKRPHYDFQFSRFFHSQKCHCQRQ